MHKQNNGRQKIAQKKQTPNSTSLIICRLRAHTKLFHAGKQRTNGIIIFEWHLARSRQDIVCTHN